MHSFGRSVVDIFAQKIESYIINYSEESLFLNQTFSRNFVTWMVGIDKLFYKKTDFDQYG